MSDPLFIRNVVSVSDDRYRLKVNPDGSINSAVTGSTVGITNKDDFTNAVHIIDHAHHEIHEGNHFCYTDSVTLGSSQSQDYLLTVANSTKWPHLLFDIDGLAVTSFFLYEATDKTGTTAQTIYNNDRNSDTIAGMTIHKGTSGGSTDGTLIYKYSGGAATGASSRIPSQSRNDNERILKQATKYILRITSGTTGNLTNVRICWYEHTNL